MTYRIVTRGVPERELHIIEEWEFYRNARARVRHLNRALREKYRATGQRAPFGYWLLYHRGAWGDTSWRNDLATVRRARDKARLRILERKFEDKTFASLAKVYQRLPLVSSNR